MIRRFLLGARRALLGAAAAVVFAFTVPAQAAPIAGLYLVMDGSGSISNANFTTQITAYQSALQSVFDLHPSIFGQVAIGGSIFGGTISEFFATTEIASQTELDSLKAAIAGLDPGRGGINTGSTAIGNAVTAAAANLLAYETGLGSNLKLVIDVTTDGQNNQGSDPTTAAAAAVTNGINAVNCLGIGAAASCGWVGSSGENFGTVSFANLGTALAGKIVTETGLVPEPGSLALLTVGLFGAIAARRRKKA